MKQFLLTPAAGKRLIAKAMAAHPAVKAAISSGTLAIIAGTTNGYVAEEILQSIGGDDASSQNSRTTALAGLGLVPHSMIY
jgi:hypothetical protein